MISSFPTLAVRAIVSEYGLLFMWAASIRSLRPNKGPTTSVRQALSPAEAYKIETLLDQRIKLSAGGNSAAAR